MTINAPMHVICSPCDARIFPGFFRRPGGKWREQTPALLTHCLEAPPHQRIDLRRRHFTEACAGILERALIVRTKSCDF